MGVKTKSRLTKEQKKALEGYKYAERQEDRYLGSVSANAHGQLKVEQATKEAYNACVKLGMTNEHGL